MKYLIPFVISLIAALTFVYQMAQEIIAHHVGESIVLGILSVVAVVNILWCICLFTE